MCFKYSYCGLPQVIANQLKDLGVTYQGAHVNKQMALAASHVREFFDEAALTVHGKLERELGREVLSTQWTKLARSRPDEEFCTRRGARTEDERGAF